MSALTDRIKARINVDANGCWLWRGAKVRKGYGVIRPANSDLNVYTHRAMFEEARGPIPIGAQIDHLCRVPACCNPEHLEAVTPAENTRRGRSVQASNDRREQASACRRGHAYTEANSYYDGRGYRSCRECRRLKHIVQRENRRRYRDFTAHDGKVVELKAAKNG